MARYRGFTYFVARKKPRTFRPPKDLSALEKTLNGWYEAHQRGRSARVCWREAGHEYWFYVRHAEPIKREGCVDLKDNVSGSQIYRPEHHDLVVYDARAGELRVHGDCPQEPELFRLAFGLHLFGDAGYFPRSREKYTLEPLKIGQRRALAPAGVARILAVTLKEVEYLTHGELWSRRRVFAEDVFSVFEAEGAGIPADADIRMARFAVVFSDAKKARMFTIRPSNYAVLGRDDDALPLQEWLRVQGFAKQPDAAEDGERFELTAAEQGGRHGYGWVRWVLGGIGAVDDAGGSAQRVAPARGGGFRLGAADAPPHGSAGGDAALR